MNSLELVDRMELHHYHTYTKTKVLARPSDYSDYRPIPATMLYTNVNLNSFVRIVLGAR